MANRYKLIHTGNRGSEINSLTEKTTPVDADMVGLMDSATSNVLKKLSWANIKATLKTYFDTLYGTSGTGAGWIALGTATYEGADDPTYTFSFASDVTGVLSAGMKIKLTQSTGGTKYCFITGVGAYSGGKTIITGYFGTDYNLENEAITAPYYSTQKAPFGFPLDPTKWTVETESTTLREQSLPSQNVWYNAENIVIPIGVWEVYYRCTMQMQESSGGGHSENITLSTANNSESDADFTTQQYSDLIGFSILPTFTKKILVLASKTTYYLNYNTNESGVENIGVAGGRGKTIIRATCSYL